MKGCVYLTEEDINELNIKYGEPVEIPNFKDYFIYRDGTILSKKIWKGKTNHIKNHFIDKDGYFWVNLMNKNVKVHRALGQAYIPNPENKPTIDHINRNKQDNRLCNLRWATHKEQNANKSFPKRSPKSNVKRIFHNKNGHRNINKTNEGLYVYRKRMYRNKVAEKSFRSKIKCLCYKYIILLRIKAGHFEYLHPNNL